jgi:Viral A-type inclusion protein repeat
MAKALLGHVGGPDPRIMSEMKRLQRRIRDLESELGRVRAENDSLAAALHEDPLLAFDDVRSREPVLT